MYMYICIDVCHTVLYIVFGAIYRLDSLAARGGAGVWQQRRSDGRLPVGATSQSGGTTRLPVIRRLVPGKSIQSVAVVVVKRQSRLVALVAFRSYLAH